MWCVVQSNTRYRGIPRKVKGKRTVAGLVVMGPTSNITNLSPSPQRYIDTTKILVYWFASDGVQLLDIVLRLQSQALAHLVVSVLELPFRL